jgi:uncharacterized damage-inducible protein DinB
MNMNHHLIDIFLFNDSTNKTLLEKIKLLPEPADAIVLFSHLINSQYKWMARIRHEAKAPEMDWWLPVYPFDKLEDEWTQSLAPWLQYLEQSADDDILKDVTFVGYDGGIWAATPADIMLQLNYHSIHHRAQIQTIIRKQGFEPDFVDYIGTKYRKI